MTQRCPDCGRFMTYAPHVGGWQCMADWCGRIVRPPAPPAPGPDWKNEGIGRVLATNDKENDK